MFTLKIYLLTSFIYNRKTLESGLLKIYLKNILKIYDRVIEHRGGLAVVQLQGSACGGCGAHIPPQTVSEVRAKSAVHTCGVCGRFLYHNKV